MTGISMVFIAGLVVLPLKNPWLNCFIKKMLFMLLLGIINGTYLDKLSLKAGAYVFKVEDDN
jgi:hypothetical protein